MRKKYHLTAQDQLTYLILLIKRKKNSYTDDSSLSRQALNELEKIEALLKDIDNLSFYSDQIKLNFALFYCKKWTIQQPKSLHFIENKNLPSYHFKPERQNVCNELLDTINTFLVLFSGASSIALLILYSVRINHQEADNIALNIIFPMILVASFLASIKQARFESAIATRNLSLVNLQKNEKFYISTQIEKQKFVSHFLILNQIANQGKIIHDVIPLILDYLIPEYENSSLQISYIQPKIDEIYFFRVKLFRQYIFEIQRLLNQIEPSREVNLGAFNTVLSEAIIEPSLTKLKQRTKPIIADIKAQFLLGSSGFFSPQKALENKLIAFEAFLNPNPA